MRELHRKTEGARAKDIVSDPNVMMGKPVVAGTRITVESILERLGAGESTEQIVTSHPRLTEEKDLIAASSCYDSSASRLDRRPAPCRSP